MKKTPWLFTASRNFNNESACEHARNRLSCGIRDTAVRSACKGTLAISTPVLMQYPTAAKQEQQQTTRLNLKFCFVATC